MTKCTELEVLLNETKWVEASLKEWFNEIGNVNILSKQFEVAEEKK